MILRFSAMAKACVITLSILILSATSQSVPGAQLFIGSGIPGGTYSLVDEYQTANFFDKFDYYNVCFVPHQQGPSADTT